MIIVTGGAGFIGSNILAGLENLGHKELVAIDRLGCDEKWKNIAKRSLFDILPPERMWEFLERWDDSVSAVIHMGAISTTTERDVDKIVESNIRLTWDLWEYCRDHRKRFIFASSAATYGGGEHGFLDRDDAAYLNALRPLNPYGWSKAFIDRKIASQRDSSAPMPPQYVGLKFFNVYGPNEYHKGEQKSVIAHIYPDVARGEAVRLFKSYNRDYPDGGQERDFVWVADIVEVVRFFLENPGICGLFNVGSGRARTFRDLAAACQKAAGQEERIQYIEMPESLRPQYQYHTRADLTKLRAAGYTAPMTPLEDGVRKYVRGFLAREDCYL
ncbi:MAG: ADP-glyceromanno-heptose 6-epimerase [Thermoguttaceae bacterium]|nr:ADP-glyceromanno-heptose 6-epimerase [Thermoguttaceae bacterium]